MPVLIISILSVLLTYLSKFRKTTYCFNLAIILLIVFWSLRYNFGNDYAVYSDNFDSIKLYSESIIELEFGWVLLNKIFSYSSFTCMVVFITILQFYSIYFYIKHYVDVKYRWFVLLFYIINISLMIHSLSGLRQTVAMSLLIFSLHYIYEKKYFPSILITLLAAQFHTSAYFLLILPLTTFLCNIKKTTYMVGVIVIFLVSFFFRSVVLNLLSSFMQFQEFSRYDEYLGQSASMYQGGGVGIIIQLLVLIILLINDRHDNTMNNWLLKLYQISFVFIPLYMIMPIFNRVQMYFLLFGLGGTTMLVKSAKNNYINIIIVLLYLVILISGFISILADGPYSNYETILSRVI